MWQERADYGHFFYRIPNGESAADAYDRISGFNESLWRSFGEDSFASVCVLVTHGLMTRVFLMKWYHFSVEYFEDLRNVNHCEFVVMKLNDGNGKYELKNQLRTWSELRREKEREQEAQEGDRVAKSGSPVPVRKRWGGCTDGCQHDGAGRRANVRRQNTADLFADEVPSPTKGKIQKTIDEEGNRDEDEYPGGEHETSKPLSRNNGARNGVGDGSPSKANTLRHLQPSERREILEAGRDGGGSRSGAVSRSGTPSSEEEEDATAKEHMSMLPVRGSMAMALSGELDEAAKSTRPYRARADTLGDQSDVDDDTEEVQDIKRQEIADKSFEGSVL